VANHREAFSTKKVSRWKRKETAMRDFVA